jgi:hypothetical protein
MNLRLWLYLFILFLLFSAPGCAPLNPSQVAPAQPQTSTPAPVLTTPTRSPATSTRLPIPTSTLPPVSNGAHPILVFPPYDSAGGFIIGAARNGTWISADEAAGLLLPEETYTLYSPMARQGSAVGGAPVAELICPSFWSVQIERPAGVAAAIAADWDGLPRMPQEVDVNDPQAVQQVGDFLIGQGISQPEVKIQRILRVDLEGDGVQEFLVAASRFVEETGHDTGPGDYSLILLYREDQTALPVVSNWYSQAGPLTFPDRYHLSAVLDLNGDGGLEILVEINGWEKTGALVFTVDGAALENVLQARCP